MNFRKMLAVLTGFGTVALLSSVFAKIQGVLNPTSLVLFTNNSLGTTDTLQLLIKLLCVYSSCIIGGMMSTIVGGGTRENLIVGAITELLVGWLWLSVVNPSWFWIMLILGVLPCVLLGNKWLLVLKGKHWHAGK
ncbi:hypothetical protein ACFP1I_32180 [Dyadobacter subterraneus]|uniref:DUF4345 domain-containing protein n=1 Tax=Dyadobacter subterraneus TaxID=2773304 RepID=A0ABR9WDX7_9BACT|nr:hypothetical protein [Dyadobacter subterraneus]MBE9463680.1 hypothetical protein [Dyadobacter subterraneus]